MEIMNLEEVITNAAIAANAGIILGYEQKDLFEPVLEKSGLSSKYTDNIEDAVIGNLLQSKRNIAYGTLKGVKNLALMRIPSVLLTKELGCINYAINLYPETLQELYDDILCSFSLVEDKKNYLSVVIHIDNIMENTREQVETMTSKTTENFLGSFSIKPDKHLNTMLEDSLETRALLQKSTESTEKIMASVSDNWKKRTKRTFQPLENYMTEQAETILLGYGSVSSNIKLAVKQLREMGEKVGFIRVHMMRPAPNLSHLNSIKKIAVIDSEIAIGSQGMLYHEVHDTNPSITSFISEIASVEQIIQAFQHVKTNEKSERVWII